MVDLKANESEAWLLRLQQGATAQAATGRKPGDLRALARKADEISTEIGELAACYDENTSPSLQHFCQEAVREAHPSMGMEKVVGQEVQDELHTCAQELYALSNAYRETGTLMRTLAAPNPDKQKLHGQALYWLRELDMHSDALKNTITLLERIRDGMDEAITNPNDGLTPYERMEQARGLENGLREKTGMNLQDIDREKMKKLMRGLFDKQRLSPVNILDGAIFDALNVAKQVNTDIQQGKFAGDMMYAISHALNEAPSATVKR